MVETELSLNLDRRAGFVTGHVTMGRRHCWEAGCGGGRTGDAHSDPSGNV